MISSMRSSQASSISEMLIQFASYKQIGVQHRPMLFQIALAHPTILADGPLLSFVNCQIGEKVISDLAVSAAVTFEKGLVCIHVFLQN